MDLSINYRNIKKKRIGQYLKRIPAGHIVTYYHRTSRPLDRASHIYTL